MNGSVPRPFPERGRRGRDIGGTFGSWGTVVKPLAEMTTGELTQALEALDDVGSEDTALRLALYLELRRAATEEWVFDEGNLSETG